MLITLRDMAVVGVTLNHRAVIYGYAMQFFSLLNAPLFVRLMPDFGAGARARRVASSCVECWNLYRHARLFRRGRLFGSTLKFGIEQRGARSFEPHVM